MLRVYKAVLNCNANGTMPRKQKAHPHLAPPHVLALPLSMSMSCPGDSRSHWIDYSHGGVYVKTRTTKVEFHSQLTMHVYPLLLQLIMILLVSMWCMYRQRAVICLETFKLGRCCLGIFASIHHQSKGSMQSNVSYLVEPAIVRFESNSFSIVCCSKRACHIMD